jgi:hypothetical protein
MKEAQKAQDKGGSSECSAAEDTNSTGSGAKSGITDGGNQGEDVAVDFGDLFPDF